MSPRVLYGEGLMFGIIGIGVAAFAFGVGVVAAGIYFVKSLFKT